MDKPNRIAQLYGYTVCLIGIVVGFISLNAILNAAFDRAAPLQSQRDFGGGGAALTSFDAYKATQDRARFTPAGTTRDTVPEAVMRQRYDALAAERTSAVRFRTTKTLATSTILLLVSVALFAFHWRWVRRVNGGTAAS